MGDEDVISSLASLSLPQPRAFGPSIEAGLSMMARPPLLGLQLAVPRSADCRSRRGSGEAVANANASRR